MITIIAQANNSDNWGTELIQQFSNMGNEVLAFIPKLLIALILLLVGFVISHIVAKGARFLIEKFGGLLKENFANNPLLERSGISGIFARANNNVPFSLIVSKTLFWILMIMFLSSSAGSLGLPQISEPLNGLVSFLPRVITAIIISVAGFVIGDLVRGFVINGAGRVGLDYAGALANLVYAFILVLVLTIAISIWSGYNTHSAYCRNSSFRCCHCHRSCSWTGHASIGSKYCIGCLCERFVPSGNKD